MKKKLIFTSIVFMTLGTPLFAAQFEGSISEWKNEKESFKKPEESFKKALQIIKEGYVDKNVTEEDLYRAATEGMLASLNKDKQSWNTLLSPRSMQNMNVELSGQVVGIGATLDFDANVGNAKVLAVIPDSAAEKAGLKKFDQILSVNGKRHKNIKDLVMDIRGKAGESVKLKVLREDRLMDFKITRAPVKIPLTVAANIDAQTGYLQIDGFTNEAMTEVLKQMSSYKDKKLKKLVLDLRSNSGGVFEKSIEVADYFLKENDVIVKTKNRDGQLKEYKAKGPAWSPETQIIILVSEETASGGEILAASLVENRKAVLVGGKTAGKWSVESIENLPNGFHIKYSVRTFLSPSGKTYDGIGMMPDFEITKGPPDNYIGYDFTKNMKSQIEKDPALRAAVEMPLPY